MDELVDFKMDSHTVDAKKASTVQIWNNLCAWIRSNGGQVHPGLELRVVVQEEEAEDSKGNSSAKHPTDPDDEDAYRGVFARQDIAKHDILIELTRHLAIDGSQMPQQYSFGEQQNQERHASPWLRCLAAYYQAQQSQSKQTIDKTAYLESLPSRYETVSLSWSAKEIDNYLSGTSPPGGAAAWSDSDKTLLQQRYLQQIRPYLESCGILMNSATNSLDLGAELAEFGKACQCLSTRAFHLQSEKEETFTNATDSPLSYTGPFLLPVIDLLNHSTRKKCTTLQSSENVFMMKAERDIVAGEEICHSYGDLTICQFLQTFGFVSSDILQAMVQSKENEVSYSPTPALLSRQLVLDSCWNVIESGLPERLSQAMQEAEMEDEIWTVCVDKSRTAEFLPDPLLVDRSEPLSDALVTCACLPFLPGCAYREAARSLIGPEILDDYFLGHLVCQSLLQAIQSRLALYQPVVWQGETHTDDRQLLRELLSTVSSSNDVEDSTRGKTESTAKRRATYGLALRLDERASLLALRRKLVEILADLGDSAVGR